jgi:iron complex transport system permease protein
MVREYTSAVQPGTTLSVLSARKWATHLSVLFGLSIVVMLACLRFGTEAISVAEMFRILSLALQRDEGLDATGPVGVILLQVRLPRIVLAFLVGGSLAAVGTALQALLRNPLADPYVLGISSGAALGGALAVLLGLGATIFAISAISLCAFAGGLVSIVLIYRIARVYEHLPVHTLLLAGVILNAIFSALIMFVTSIMDPNRTFGMMAWLMGTLVGPTLPTLAVLAMYLTIGAVVLFMQARPLNLLTLGEETARSLGVEVERVKKVVFFTSALLTGAAVSVSGMIGFVGMVVPHAVRMVVGPDHRLVLPAAALIGGMFLVIADTVARTVMAPSEIPVGVVTALVGGPVFIYLLMSGKGSPIYERGRLRA